jgi:hypothetical protein
MVATSATAILNDIALSASLGRPFRALMICLKPQKIAGCRQSAHAFLTAYVNQPVSALGFGAVPRGETKEMLETK